MKELLGRIGHCFFSLRITLREALCLTVATGALLGGWMIFRSQRKPHNEAGTQQFHADFIAKTLNREFDPNTASVVRNSGNLPIVRELVVGASRDVTPSQNLKAWDLEIRQQIVGNDSSFSKPLQSFSVAPDQAIAFGWRTQHKDAFLMVCLVGERTEKLTFPTHEREYVFAIRIVEY